MSYKNISSNELKKLIQNNENILLIDVRSEEEFEEVNIENINKYTVTRFTI